MTTFSAVCMLLCITGSLSMQPPSFPINMGTNQAGTNQPQGNPQAQPQQPPQASTWNQPPSPPNTWAPSPSSYNRWGQPPSAPSSWNQPPSPANNWGRPSPPSNYWGPQSPQPNSWGQPRNSWFPPPQQPMWGAPQPQPQPRTWGQQWPQQQQQQRPVFGGNYAPPQRPNPWARPTQQWGQPPPQKRPQNSNDFFQQMFALDQFGLMPMEMSDYLMYGALAGNQFGMPNNRANPGGNRGSMFPSAPLPGLFNMGNQQGGGFDWAAASMLGFF